MLINALETNVGGSPFEDPKTDFKFIAKLVRCFFIGISHNVIDKDTRVSHNMWNP